jgi:hypothetical protein
MPLSGGRELARRIGSRIELRPDALRCRLRMRGFIAADSHEIDCAFTFSVLALDQPAERQMLAETFLDNDDSVTAEEVAEHFLPSLHDAATQLIAQQPAEHWIEEANRQPLLDALRQEGNSVAFACGVELLPPFELTVESPTLHREKIEVMQRKLTERRAAGQAEHVQKAAELLRQFQSLRDAAPAGLSPGKILEQVSPADRGNMLETLLLASSAGCEQMLWAVAGPNLVKIDPRATPPRAEMIPLPGDLGPLRSVQSEEVDGTKKLLVGAQSGVVVVDAQHPTDVQRYADRAITSAMGFNAVVAAGDMIWATHAEAGTVGWRIGEFDKPAFTLRPQASAVAPTPSTPPPLPTSAAGNASIIASMRGGTGAGSGSFAATSGPRNAAALDSRRILYSAGGTVFIADDTGTSGVVSASSATVVFIAIEDDIVQIVRADGTVDRLDATSLQRLGSDRRCGEITAAAPLPWLGTTRLLLATSDGPICCVGRDDPLVTQYVSPHRGVRALAATNDCVAGLSADRQRIVLWKSWDGRQPSGEIHIAHIARHRAADVCFG